MAQQRGSSPKRRVEQYKHKDKERLNNPPAGLVTPETDPDAGQKKTYAYDPHLDPQLVWAGKAEHTSFEVPTVSLHVHERIDPSTIIEAVLKRNGEQYQPSLFETPEENPPIRQAVEFYKHAHGWSNRLVAGDSLLVMNSLLEKEGMAGKVQMIYIDPPYGIKYGSNFQPFVNNRDVKDGKDEDLTAEPEQIRAFRDTWELGIHSYLTYLRDRLLLARELLTESGSIFVQISDENVHHVRELMDEVFGKDNFVSVITVEKTSGFTEILIPSVTDFLVWYAKDKKTTKYNQLYSSKKIGGEGGVGYTNIESPDGRESRPLTKEEMDDPRRIPKGWRPFFLGSLASQGQSANTTVEFEFNGKNYFPGHDRHWTVSLEGLKRLAEVGRIAERGNGIAYVRYLDDYPVQPIVNVWSDTGGGGFIRERKVYVVQTAIKVLERCLLMTTDPGDLVFDPTCVRKGTGVWGSPTPALPVHGEGASLSPRLRGDDRGAAVIPIETIRPDDYVLGHDAQPHRVLRLIRKWYRGEMIGIRHEHSEQTLWLTADHKVLAHRRPHTLGGRLDWSAIPQPLRGRSKELRREMTPPERKLWQVLRKNQLGITFRRQHPIGPYIGDFYCREAALVVEVDGAAAHGTEEALAHDQARDAFMQSLGLKIIRIPAVDVERNLEAVWQYIGDVSSQQFSPETAEWIKAKELRKGDLVFFGAGRMPARIVEVITEFTEEEVYDLEVEGVHSFLTEVCAVHNCGSGTTAYVAEQWGRRWITCDTSRVALTLARQRLMTAMFDYYELAHLNEGVGSGFKYKTVPHVTLKSIANNPEIDGIYARMHPAVEQALAELNRALKGKPVKFKVTQGGRQGQFVDFAAPDSATLTMPSGQVVKVNGLLESEVPFEFPADWPKETRQAFESFHRARRAMREKIDEAIAQHAPQETLYDQPFVDRKKVRVTGPFTVEAVPAPAVKSIEESLTPTLSQGEREPTADASVARSGETLRQAEWRDELLKTGIRGRGRQSIRFVRLEPLAGCRWLHADGETSGNGATRAVVSFGPDHAPLEQRQVASALEEAQRLVPRPKLIIFAAFQFDPEAAKDIEETNWPGVTLLKVQMNADLLTEDLKKKRASNESFWLIGQPDVQVERITEGEHAGKVRVSVNGFDYYNTVTGNIESGGPERIAMWLLDTDYDGRSLFPRQVFFPMAGDDEGWAKLSRNLRAEIDPDLIEAYRGTVSLPFGPGEHKRIAVKIVDDRGIESLKVMNLR